jgi:hypothetical protein
VELEVWLQWLQATSIATAIRENEILFPWIESIHVLAITLVIGSISIVDLRLLGVASLERAADRLMGEVLPLTWGAFAVGATTGALLFSSNATTYAHNFYFQGKMLLLTAAALNMSLFHIFGMRGIARWGRAKQTPLPAKMAGAISLLLWICVVAFGRWIGFTLH